MAETIDPEARLLTSSELSALSNERLVQRWESLNNGALHDQLSIEECRNDQKRLVLKEMGIRFPKMYRDFLAYIVAPDQTLESLKRTNQDLLDLGNRLIAERDYLRTRVDELERELQRIYVAVDRLATRSSLEKDSE